MSDRVAVMSEGRIRQLGSPVDVYRSPADPFVAGFVGDNNRLRGQLVSVHAKQAIVALGDALVNVPGESLSGLEKSAAVDLFVRPEQFNVVAPEEPCAIKGSVVAQIYQGGHVDLQIECSGSAGERLLVRSPGEQAVLRWPMGAPVGIAIQADRCSAFPAA